MANTPEQPIQNINQQLTPEPAALPQAAHGATFTGAVGGALEQVGNEGLDFATQRAQAQQNMWLSQAKSAAELSAQSLSETAQRNAQPGQPTLGTVQTQWQQHVASELDNIDNPILKARYGEALNDIGGNLNKTTQAFDYQQQDAYTMHNLQSTINNKAALYHTMRDQDAIAAKAQADVGELTTHINPLPIPPDKRMAALDEMRKGIVLSAMDAQIGADPLGFLNQNAPARSPQAFLNDPNSPRGIRNNNPGNLEGDQGFQGFKQADDGGYAQFDTPENGLRAMAINLRNQQDMHGLNTVADIVSKYAPPDKNDTASYIANVSKALKVQPDDEIDMHDPATLTTFMKAAIKQENGAVPYSDRNIGYAAMQAVKPEDAGENPGMTRADGTIRTGNPLMALVNPQEQETVIQHAEAVYKQQRSFQIVASGQANAQLSQIEESLNKGYAVDPDVFKQVSDMVQQSGTPAVQTRFARAQTRSQSLQDFMPMAPTQLQNYLQDSLKPVIDSGKATPDQVQRYDVGQQFLKTLTDQVKTDPLTAYARGSQKPMPPVETADAQSFSNRAAFAGGAQQLYGTSFKAFTPAEVPRIAASFAQATPQGQRAFLTNFAQGFGDKTPDAAAQVWGKDAPEIAYAASMLGVPNIGDQQQQTAMGIVAGAQRIQQDKDKSIPVDKVDQQMQALGYDTALPPGPAYDNGKAAARALYASRFNGNNTGNMDTVTQAIKDVMGPLTKANGTPVIPPLGVDSDAFTKFVQNMTPQQFNAGLENARMTGAATGPQEVQLPKNDDGNFDPSKDKVRLKTLADGLYQLTDKNGKPYINPDKTFTVLKYSSQDIH